MWSTQGHLQKKKITAEGWLCQCQVWSLTRCLRPPALCFPADGLGAGQRWAACCASRTRRLGWRCCAPCPLPVHTACILYCGCFIRRWGMVLFASSGTARPRGCKSQPPCLGSALHLLAVHAGHPRAVGKIKLTGRKDQKGVCVCACDTGRKGGG